LFSTPSAAQIAILQRPLPLLHVGRHKHERRASSASDCAPPCQVTPANSKSPAQQTAPMRRPPRHGLRRHQRHVLPPRPGARLDRFTGLNTRDFIGSALPWDAARRLVLQALGANRRQITRHPDSAGGRQVVRMKHQIQRLGERSGLKRRPPRSIGDTRRAQAYTFCAPGNAPRLP